MKNGDICALSELSNADPVKYKLRHQVYFLTIPYDKNGNFVEEWNHSESDPRSFMKSKRGLT